MSFSNNSSRTTLNDKAYGTNLTLTDTLRVPTIYLNGTNLSTTLSNLSSSSSSTPSTLASTCTGSILTLSSTLSCKSIEVGPTVTATKKTYIDLKTYAGNSDYDSRILVTGGSSSTAGQGALELNAASCTINSPLTVSSITNVGSLSTVGITNTGALTQTGSSTLGTLSVTDLNVSGFPYFDGVLNQTLPTDTTGSKDGLGIFWNTSSGHGNTGFLNYAQGGDGGFGFYTASNTIAPKLLLYVDASGNITNVNNISCSSITNSGTLTQSGDATFSGLLTFAGGTSTTSSNTVITDILQVQDSTSSLYSVISNVNSISTATSSGKVSSLSDVSTQVYSFTVRKYYRRIITLKVPISLSFTGTNTTGGTAPFNANITTISCNIYKNGSFFKTVTISPLYTISTNHSYLATTASGASTISGEQYINLLSINFTPDYLSTSAIYTVYFSANILDSNPFPITFSVNYNCTLSTHSYSDCSSYDSDFTGYVATSYSETTYSSGLITSGSLELNELLPSSITTTTLSATNAVCSTLNSTSITSGTLSTSGLTNTGTTSLNGVTVNGNASITGSISATLDSTFSGILTLPSLYSPYLNGSKYVTIRGTSTKTSGSYTHSYTSSENNNSTTYTAYSGFTILIPTNCISMLSQYSYYTTGSVSYQGIQPFYYIKYNSTTWIENKGTVIGAAQYIPTGRILTITADTFEYDLTFSNPVSNGDVIYYTFNVWMY